MKKAFAILLCCTLAPALNAKTGAEKFSGFYTDETADTVSEITLLPDQTFCYAFMGGSLDLLVAGHWKVINTNSVHVQEYDQKLPVFIVRPSENEDDLTVTTEQFHFSGHSLADDITTVFGTSRDNLRPILSPEHNGFDAWYKIDAPKNTSSYFIGHIKSNGSKAGYAIYQVAEYEVNFAQSKVMNVYSSTNMNRRKIDDTLTLQGNQLKFSEYDSGFTKQKPLKAKTIAQIKSNCVTPYLNGGNKKTWIKPKQEFEIELPVDGVKPYFENLRKNDGRGRVFNG